MSLAQHGLRRATASACSFRNAWKSDAEDAGFVEEWRTITSYPTFAGKMRIKHRIGAIF